MILCYMRKGILSKQYFMHVDLQSVENKVRSIVHTIRQRDVNDKLLISVNTWHSVLIIFYDWNYINDNLPNRCSLSNDENDEIFAAITNYKANI